MENKYAHSDFDSFYLEYSLKLWRLAYRLTRNRYDSEDLVDEAFLIYLQKSTTMVIDNPEAYIMMKSPIPPLLSRRLNKDGTYNIAK